MGRRLSAALLAALQPGTRGEAPEPPDPGVTATITMQPSSWHTRRRASLEGTYGPNTSGRYIRIPGNGNDVPNRYVYCTNNDGSGRQVGIDPGPLVAELSGYTGVAAALGSGPITAAARATAIRTALDGLYPTIGGSGADVVITGDIGSVTTGGIHGATGGVYGTRRSTPQFFSSALDGRVGQFGVWSGGSVRITGLGIYLANTSTSVRLALYTGGSTPVSGSGTPLSGTTRRVELQIPAGGAVGWQWAACTPSEVYTLANGNFRLVAKSNGSSIPGYIGTGDRTGTDFPDAGSGATHDLEIYSSMSTDPSASFPSSLSGESVSNAGVYLMMGFQWRAADGSSGVFTTRIGVQPGVAVTDLAQTSSLTAPDAGGADLFMGVANPGMLGMVWNAWGIAQGTQHSTQGRAFVAAGGSIGNAPGALVLWEDRTTGSGTNAWLEIAIPGNVAVPSSGPLWWGVRNNATTFNFRFAFNAQRDQASPDANPADWNDASEYEIFRSVNGDGTGGNVHTTDPAVAIASPIATDGAGVATNQNYPGSYISIRLPEDIAA